MRVDVWSDISCPWCFVGTRRLQQALEGMTAEVVFHPFLLRPDLGPEGDNVQEMLKQKYGRDPEQMFAPVHQAAQISGIPLDLRKQPMIYNTVEAHALLQVAHERNLQVQLTDALFRAYFLEARNISQREVLTEVAAVEGLTSVEIESAWGRAPQVRREARDASKRGIRGVPFFVFQGELAVSGAQPVEALRSALRQASAV